MNYFLGCDPGLTGAIVKIDGQGNLVEKYIMPIFESHVKKSGKNSIKRAINVAELAGIFLNQKNITLAVLELVGSMPGQGVASCFSFGRSYGMAEMGLAAAKIPYRLVSPQKWTKAMHQGISKEFDSKERTRMILSRQYPHLDLKETPRCKKPHSGLADAYLMALYGLQLFSSGQAGISSLQDDSESPE